MEVPFTEMEDCRWNNLGREMISRLLLFMYNLKCLFDIPEAVGYTSLDIRERLELQI